MILIFSGGGSPWIPEIQLDDAAIMLSYYVNVNQKTKKTDKRLERAMTAREQPKRKKICKSRGKNSSGNSK